MCMKKIISTAFVALAFAAVSTVDAKETRKMQPAVSEQPMKKRPRPTARPIQQQGTQQSTARKISNATDDVKDAIKATQTANGAAKTMAKQEANDAVADLLATMHQRTWMGDLRGYSEDQVKDAGKKLELLFVEEKNLNDKIAAQQAKVDEMTDKGWFWNAPKEGKTEERATATTELKNLKNRLASVKAAIHSESVVAGKAYALSIKRAVYLISAAAAAGVVYAIDAYGFDGRGKAYLSEQFGKTYAKLPKVPYFGAEARAERELQARLEGSQLQEQNEMLKSLKVEKRESKRFEFYQRRLQEWVDLTTEYKSRRAAGEEKNTPEMSKLLKEIDWDSEFIWGLGFNNDFINYLKKTGLYNAWDNSWENASKEVVENLTNAGIYITDKNLLINAGITKEKADTATAKAITEHGLATAKTRKSKSSSVEAKRLSPR